MLVDQLRVENAALKAMVSGMQMQGHPHNPHPDGDEAKSNNVEHGASHLPYLLTAHSAFPYFQR